MFRLPRAFRLRQQYPLYHPPQIVNRPVSQILHNKHGDPYRYQSVRFKRPIAALFSWKKIASFTLYFTTFHIALSLYTKYTGFLVDELLDEAELEESLEGAYADEGNTFIPLTWARRLPRTFYKGSDPEWQEFIRVAKDRVRAKKIQDELVQLVYRGTQAHPTVAQHLGTKPKVGRYWLEVTFPDAPPQEYERSGLEIGEGFMAWSQQKIGAEQWWRTTRALWPSAAFEGVYATASVLAGIQYRRMKHALGWEGKDPFSPEERFRHAVEMMQKHTHARQSKSVGAQTDPDAPAASSAVNASPQSQNSPESSPRPAGISLPYLPTLPLPAKSGTTNPDIPIAMHVFSANVKKTWNPKKSEPPRGSFVVSGLVEVKGEKGRILFDVQSFYDPSQGKFLRVDAAVRNVKRWKQGPKGGG